ncbi:hypothetical protein P153DRAFT_387469 [Dothidotthia symphoricarpi CBS 119687]|uniref:Uncharacterized protein n=1 Tax=Dothidotthia symphoricarpi CBS 119687 TaxID=1392245 RepID=A0A6A6A851_9PLEO|nr:uncharacterized protein P153DRAFT_387469 [Dothidotthia symphoricarpi CBS 119687]KAF2127736.1 hypothetical protein P153DRAFT_387469 [Dothidotthia symphoricarpi CBS 119687]
MAQFPLHQHLAKGTLTMPEDTSIKATRSSTSAASPVADRYAFSVANNKGCKQMPGFTQANQSLPVPSQPAYLQDDLANEFTLLSRTSYPILNEHSIGLNGLNVAALPRLDVDVGVGLFDGQINIPFPRNDDVLNECATNWLMLDGPSIDDSHVLDSSSALPNDIPYSDIFLGLNADQHASTQPLRDAQTLDAAYPMEPVYLPDYQSGIFIDSMFNQAVVDQKMHAVALGDEYLVGRLPFNSSSSMKPMASFDQYSTLKPEYIQMPAFLLTPPFFNGDPAPQSRAASRPIMPATNEAGLNSASSLHPIQVATA